MFAIKTWRTKKQKVALHITVRATFLNRVGRYSRPFPHFDYYKPSTQSNLLCSNLNRENLTSVPANFGVGHQTARLIIEFKLNDTK